MSVDTYTKCFSFVQDRKQLRTAAVLEYETDWAKVEVLTPGVTISRLDGYGSMEAQIYNGVTVSQTSILAGTPNSMRFTRGLIPFAIIGNGDPIDILITHGRCKKWIGDSSGRASVHINGVTYATQSNGSGTNPKNFYKCPLVGNKTFYIPAMLRFETDWAKVQVTSPGTTLVKLPGFDDTVTSEDSGRSIAFRNRPSGISANLLLVSVSVKTGPAFTHGAIPFVIVNNGGPIDIVVTRGRDKNRSNDLAGRAEVQIGDRSYTNATGRNDPTNPVSFKDCPVIQIPSDWQPKGTQEATPREQQPPQPPVEQPVQPPAQDPAPEPVQPQEPVQPPVQEPTQDPVQPPAPAPEDTPSVPEKSIPDGEGTNPSSDPAAAPEETTSGSTNTGTNEAENAPKPSDNTTQPTTEPESSQGGTGPSGGGNKDKDPFWFLKDVETPAGSDAQAPAEKPATEPPVTQPSTTETPATEPVAPEPAPATETPVTEHAASEQPSDSAPGEIFALTIGIDQYRNTNDFFRPLSGAAADADDIVELCATTFRVPRDRIVSLRDEQATRANIISAIRDLGDNPAIKSNDPILIFYAGHGSHTAPPEGWPAKGDVQMILPWNFVPNSTKDSPVDDQGILDLQLSRLLNDIAKKKSNNITVIMDCCHSASGTRAERVATHRGVVLPKSYTISQALVDEVTGKTRGSNVAKGFDKKGLASHVLLAACKETELANEVPGKSRGAFTCSLTTLLREQGAGKLSYSEIILRLPKLELDTSIIQSPQCEGVHQYRTLFDGRVPNLRSQLFEVAALKNKPDDFRMYAGEAEGVVPGAVFAIYRDRDMQDGPIGFVEAQPVTNSKGNTTTDCKTKAGTERFDLKGKTGYAVQTDSGSAYKARFFLDLGPAHKAIFEAAQKEMQTTYASGRQVEFVKDRNDTPDLVVTAQGQYAIFENMDVVCQKAGLSIMPFTNTIINSDNILRILRASADFFFHLRRSSTHESYQILSGNVDIKAHKLVYTTVPIPGTLKKVLMPEDPNTSLIEDDVLQVPSSSNTNYGFTVTSNFKDSGLFASLFYFDMSDLSISRYYLPVLAKRDVKKREEGAGRVHSIPPDGKALTIGYGESGTEPRSYTVRAGQEVDVGFLRLFVSTDYADWTMIEQNSPFRDTRGSGTGSVQQAVVGWGAKTIPVIITKSDELVDEEEEYESDVVEEE